MNTIIAPIVASPLDPYRGRGITVVRQLRSPSPCPCNSKECKEAYEADIKQWKIVELKS